MPEDSSIMTYRGHRVKKTLIRAKFSPMETTGQRYIYTGCGTGRLIGEFMRSDNCGSALSLTQIRFISISVYDVLTGKIVNSNRAHKDIVRDVAWHPKRNEILTSSWDCRVCLHSYQLSKRSQLKRCLSQTDCSHDNKSNSSGDNQGPPPRRSRRLANRRLAQETNWFMRHTQNIKLLLALVVCKRKGIVDGVAWFFFCKRNNNKKEIKIPRSLTVFFL